MAKRGWKELRGASGDVVAIRDCSTAFCRSVGTIEAGQVNNPIAPVCTSRMVSKLQTALGEESVEASGELGGSERAVVDVHVTYYNPPEGVLAVVGKSGLLIVRAQVSDGGGSQQGDLLVAVATEAVRSGETDMAKECAKTICKYIVDRAKMD